jgi:hypothetical protein
VIARLQRPQRIPRRIAEGVGDRRPDAHSG